MEPKELTTEQLTSFFNYMEMKFLLHFKENNAL